MIDVCCGLSASPALFVPPVNPCTCTLVAMLVLAGCLPLSLSIFVALSGVAVTHIVLRDITITLAARTLKEAPSRVQNGERRSRFTKTSGRRGLAREPGPPVGGRGAGREHTWKSCEGARILGGVIYPRPSARRFARTARGIENRFGGRERADA